MATEFHRIILSDETLKISSVSNEDGDIYNKSLLDNSISLQVTKNEWKITIEETPSAPTNQSIVPFGKVGDLAELKFGRISTPAKFEIQTQKGQNQDDWAKHRIARDSAFYMVVIGEDVVNQGGQNYTIGTDDMRNGKANVNVFSLEGDKKVYLKLIKNSVDNNKRDLIVGYTE